MNMQASEEMGIKESLEESDILKMINSIFDEIEGLNEKLSSVRSAVNTQANIFERSSYELEEIKEDVDKHKRLLLNQEKDIALRKRDINRLEKELFLLCDEVTEIKLQMAHFCIEKKYRTEPFL
ncbi:unnamed protein product [Lepeophtheirus salmonis]|uniref:(salmon louse) hypothetical protein n=1 Tax=Lepeophtheirus salmonis TaxID=72036 RepID=A0A7R8H9C2_LEPSM|nr:unnamed protein product [Lepeophtheirus salmonis]CAF2956291.1 unnamed protein product [Lepeophtheirus salmonis]